jgi:hypothetical protein
MAITYTWTVDSMSVIQSPDPDFVVLVQWTCTGTDGTNTADIGGSTIFATQQGGTFVPYADLSEVLILGWVSDDLGPDGVSNMEATVEGQINSIVSPPISPTIEPLPWA